MSWATSLKRCAVAIAAAPLVAALAAGCGGGQSASPTPSPPAPQTPVAIQTQPPSSPVSGENIIDLAAGGAQTVIWGVDSGDYFNDMPLLTTGDVNGDGLADLLIGARFGDGPDNLRQDSGEAYLIFGRKEWPPEMDIRAAAADVTLYGAAPNDQLGMSGALADVNGDGLADVIVSAPFAVRSDNRAQAGAVYVIFGKKELPSVIDLASGKPDVFLIGPEGSSFFGDSVAAGDVNGDGVADIIVGATFAHRPQGLPRAGAAAGAAYVVFGGSGLAGTIDMAAKGYGLAVYGDNDQPHPDELGDNVATGDINDDGIADVIITAEAADGPNNDRSVAAEVHVVFGRKDLGGIVDIGAGQADLSVFGADANDTIGFNIGSGDVTGDGVDDLLITARGADGPGNRTGEAGEVHVIPGGRNLPKTIDFLTDEGSYVYGSDGADMLAYGLATVDTDGDGVRELFIGTGFGDGPRNDRMDAGEAFLIDARTLNGPMRPSEASVELTLYGAHPDDQLGAALTAGDLDGDGRPELVLLAIRADGPGGARPDAGAIYIVKR